MASPQELGVGVAGTLPELLNASHPGRSSRRDPERGCVPSPSPDGQGLGVGRLGVGQSAEGKFRLGWGKFHPMLYDLESPILLSGPHFPHLDNGEWDGKGVLGPFSRDEVSQGAGRCVQAHSSAWRQVGTTWTLSTHGLQRWAGAGVWLCQGSFRGQGG